MNEKRNFSDFRDVSPISPAAAYVGGKRQLAKRLAEIIETQPHQCYAEPFVGMGGVFLKRRKIPKVEAINDLSSDIANFFRILQRHEAVFLEMLKWRIASREEFERFKTQNPDSLTDLERAVRFFYIQRIAYGGRPYKPAFGASTTSGSRFNFYRLEPLLSALHKRLSRVTIERLDWPVFIERYDRQQTFFFLDPPYYKCEKYYGADLFKRADFSKLAKALADIKGKFLMTLNDLPETRAIFQPFRIQTAQVTYTLQGNDNRKSAQEILISNF